MSWAINLLAGAKQFGDLKRKAEALELERARLVQAHAGTVVDLRRVEAERDALIDQLARLGLGPDGAAVEWGARCIDPDCQPHTGDDGVFNVRAARDQVERFINSQERVKRHELVCRHQPTGSWERVPS